MQDFINAAFLLILCMCSVYIGRKIGFSQIFSLRKMLSGIKKINSDDKLSVVKSLTNSLASTLGVGNIVGVASAIALGGYGSIFWMWVGAILLLPVKYSEVFLSMIYRKKNVCGYYGGPMYYIEKTKPLGRKFALAFSILCIVASFFIGNMLQTSSAANALFEVFGLDMRAVAFVFFIITFIVTLAGFGTLSNFTLLVIPVASFIYIALSLYVILANVALLHAVFLRIFEEALDIKSVFCGSASALLLSIRHGITKGIMSNEAGCGTSPIAHAASDNKDYRSQSFLGVFEVIADTLIMCTLSALVILIADQKYGLKMNGPIDTVIIAYSAFFGRFAEYFIGSSVFVFAISTVISWSNYASRSIYYISPKNYKILNTIYLTLYAASCLFAIRMTDKSIIEITDYINVMMVGINITALIANQKIIRDKSRL